MMKKASILIAVGLVLMTTPAAFSVPYKVDSHTLHLYHFDGDTLDSVTTNPIDLTVDSGATVTDASYPGMGQALHTYEGTASTNVNLPSAMASAEQAISNFVGADGAFTFEALVCPAFNLGSIPNNMQIISGEHNSARGWQFRVESAGNLVFTKLTGTVQDNMRTALPSSGPHAFAANKWFHAAVTYNGLEDTDGNLKLYWTAIDSGVSEPALLGSFRMAADLTATVAPNFVIGNEGRNSNGRTENWEGWIDEVRISDIARAPSEMVTDVLAGQATRPSPANGATDVPADALLTWTASESAVSHDVYFGTTLADVETADRDHPMDVLRIEGQSTAAYAPQGPLDFGRTYYWRIDEVNAASDNPVVQGDVWSFTVETYTYPLSGDRIMATASSACANMGPEKTTDGSGLDAQGRHSTRETDMWLSVKDAPEPVWIQYEFDNVYKLDTLLVWNHNSQAEGFIGYGVMDVTIEYSGDGDIWTSLGDFVFVQAPGDDTCAAQPVDLGGIVAKSVRLMIHTSWGGFLAQYGLSEVQFLYIPTRAWDLRNEGTGAEVLLTWRAGREAACHRVYIGTDEQAVAEGTSWVQTTEDNRLDLGTLQLGTTYYCRVDEVNEAAVPSVWQGDVWSFITTEFLVIDDFEGYNDDDNCVFDTWEDGYIDKSSGSQVGYTDSTRGTFGETTIVHAGDQSMPLFYNNADSPYYSEATRTFASALNLLSNGADTLALWVHGDATNAPADVYVTVGDKSGKTATVTDSTLLTATEWALWKIPYSSLTGVNAGTVTKLIVGVDSRNAATRGSGVLYIDDVGFGHPADE
ncbi:MAG TPA: discoidin domain-containing protein [Sedimentisphaerales bacterium]|jgi:hypothetical protein|nr:discoidin domain-containing protein [Sedimentisphaerales bacterium]HNU30179.1 discoidin domain-containing protein [Sedimentisphaerales bacterium]